jgi:hypothetical protein
MKQLWWTQHDNQDKPLQNCRRHLCCGFCRAITTQARDAKLGQKIMDTNSVAQEEKKIMSHIPHAFKSIDQVESLIFGPISSLDPKIDDWYCKISNRSKLKTGDFAKNNIGYLADFVIVATEAIKGIE